MNKSSKGPCVEIRSSRGQRCLRFHDRKGDYFITTIEGDGPQAVKSIWGHTDCEFLVQLFQSIARDWKGWQGERAWESIEGDLRISISSRSTGQITISVNLRNNDGEDDWRLVSPIFTEAGQLEGIARKISLFFNGPGASTK